MQQQQKFLPGLNKLAASLLKYEFTVSKTIYHIFKICASLIKLFIEPLTIVFHSQYLYHFSKSKHIFSIFSKYSFHHTFINQISPFLSFF